MVKRKLESLICRFHEPESALLKGVIENQQRQLGYMERTRSYAQPSGAKRISREIKEKKPWIKELKKECDILHAWRVALDPYVDPLELIPLYNSKNISVPADIAQWSKRFDFFELTFGGSIFVRRGMTVKKLEIGIIFDPELTEKVRHSIAYSIFPTNEWKKYGEISVVFGLSGDLGFKVPLAPNGTPLGKIGDVGPQLKAEFLLGPFLYTFRKAVIRGVGKGNYLVNWIIEKGKILSGGDFETRVVLKVPKGRAVVKARVAMQATVTPPGFWQRVLGKTRKMAPDEKTYEIALS